MARAALISQRFLHHFPALRCSTFSSTVACHTKYFSQEQQKHFPFCATHYNHHVKCFNENSIEGCRYHFMQMMTSRSLSTDQDSGLDHVTYERVVGEALENLTEIFESLDELDGCPKEYDVQYADGVLTVTLGRQFGTYVINKQTPNKQIWLSSPTSGPKRYDFVNGRWIYSHDGKALHDLLNEEFSAIFKQDLDFTQAENYS